MVFGILTLSATAVFSASENNYFPIDATRYRLGPEDVLEIWMPLSAEQGKFPVAGIALPYEAFGNEVYSKNSVKVDPYGNISVPLLGEVSAIGLTMDELAASIKEKLRKYLVNPQVTIIVTDYASFTIRNRICVIGEVLLPGVHTMPIGDTMRVTEAVSLAAGYKQGACLSSVIVAKKDPQEGVTFTKIDFNKALLGDPKENLVLKPGDCVYVPKQFIAHVDTFVEFFFSKTDPVLKYYLDIYDIRQTLKKW